MVLVPNVTQSDVEEIADDVRECDQRPMVYYARLSTDRMGHYRVTVVAKSLPTLMRSHVHEGNLQINSIVAHSMLDGYIRFQFEIPDISSDTPRKRIV